MEGVRQKRVPMLAVNQWLPEWDKIGFDSREHRAKPEKKFYVFSLSAPELRSLSGIARRTARGGVSRTDELGIQRQHDPERSGEIGRFVEFGYPWSTLSVAKRATSEFHNLRKPGWLPTAIVLNVIAPGVERNGETVAAEDLVSVIDVDGQPHLQLPYEAWSGKWSPSRLAPFEVIDGQHRLWAFEGPGAARFANFELPVVAFVGLDVSWQAYLFWTINIKPKRINASLAFDLYPLLRNEDWLDRAEGHPVYRETRAQELVEILWSYPDSAWYDRINMLGERQNPWVTQSAWIKSLLATFVRTWDKRAGTPGGLFGSRSVVDDEVLGWSRSQQAAFLIFAWRAFKDSVAKSNAIWAITLRNVRKNSQQNLDLAHDPAAEMDQAFYGPYSLINTDQGVRGFLHVLNDLSYQRASHLKLNKWLPEEKADANPILSVETSLKSLNQQDFRKYIFEIATAISSFDWRTSSAPDLDEQTRRAKLVFRGSGGYKELRAQLLEHLAEDAGDIGAVAKRLVAQA